MKFQEPIDAKWEDIEDKLGDEELSRHLLKKFKISTVNGISKPKIGFSFKPFVLLFDEMYTEVYRFSEAESWMHSAEKIVFIGTSFSVNITSIALRIAISKNIPVEIVDPEPIILDYDNIKYHSMSAEEYCDKN